jgi:hypothetical protein
MSFSIIGLGPDGIRTATRTRPASAVVLADRWKRAGIQGLTVREGDLQPEPLESFRRRIYGPVASRTLREFAI